MGGIVKLPIAKGSFEERGKEAAYNTHPSIRNHPCYELWAVLRAVFANCP
jgi:hypothetical protein